MSNERLRDVVMAILEAADEIKAKAGKEKFEEAFVAIVKGGKEE